MKNKYKILLFIITIALVLNPLSTFGATAEEQFSLSKSEKEFDCKSVVLMEAQTGTVLFEQNPNEALPPASVTKIMTLLLVTEAIDNGKLKLDDIITTSANAASMGGSQVYLKEGEEMTAEDMIKSVVISSANDAAVALAEHIEGSEEVFVQKMNEKARELGMENTNFENTNGLDDTATNHVTSAMDIAIMSKELIKHNKILEYSSIWMDTIRNGEFGLTNTNRLVRFYKGATGLKTGSTAKAGFCISATASREGMSLICVIMGAPTRDIRNQIATQVLDWGFSNFSVYTHSGNTINDIYISSGKESYVNASYPDFSCIVNKSEISKIEASMQLSKNLSAPIKQNEEIGKMIYKIGNTEIGSVSITVEKNIEKADFGSIFYKIFCQIILNI